jgi:cytochrome c oxidase subunit 1
MLTTSYFLLLSLPVIAASITAFLIGQNLNTHFFNWVGTDSPILFQHIFELIDEGTRVIIYIEVLAVVMLFILFDVIL